jgi:hypothetical protein
MTEDCCLDMIWRLQQGKTVANIYTLKASYDSLEVFLSFSFLISAGHHVLAFG